MKIDLNVAEKEFVMVSRNHAVTICRLPGQPDILGVATLLESNEGIKFPSFTISCDQEDGTPFDMPVIYMLEAGGTATYEVLPEDYTAYLRALPHRQHLAAFADAVCEKAGWAENEYVRLNAVHYLERAEITQITEENLQQAAKIVRDCYEMVISFCQTYQMAAAPKVH